MLLHFVLLACSTPSSPVLHQSSAASALESISQLRENAQQLHEDATRLHVEMSVFRSAAIEERFDAGDAEAIQRAVQDLRNQTVLLEKNLQKASNHLQNGQKLR